MPKFLLLNALASSFRRWRTFVETGHLQRFQTENFIFFNIIPFLTYFQYFQRRLTFVIGWPLCLLIRKRIRLIYKSLKSFPKDL